jgi:hypothetical protein
VIDSEQDVPLDILREGGDHHCTLVSFVLEAWTQ